MVILNNIIIDNEIMFRFLRLSELPGGGHPSIRQQKFVSQSRASSIIPEWMYASGIDYFDKKSLLKENDDLAARLPIQSPWLAGSDVSGVYPGKIDPKNIILIANNILYDYSASIFFDNKWRLAVMDRIDGRICWVEVFDGFENFLDSLGV